MATETPQQQPIPHHEWDLQGHEDFPPDSEIDQATAMYAAARRILQDNHAAKPAGKSQSEEDKEYDRLDRVSGPMNSPEDLRRRVGLED